MPSTDSAPTATRSRSRRWLAPRGSIARSCIATTTCAPRILALAAEPEPHPASTGISRRSLLADLANLREHNERLRHQNAKLTERLSEVLGEQVFHDAGLTRTDETSTLRKRVAELEQQLLDRRQDLQDRDDELAAARAANRDLITTLNGRTR